MTHGTTYWIYVYATDNAYPPPGNTESTGGNIKSLFLYDTQAGTSTISVPPTGEPHYKSLTTISGTCYDDFSSPDKVLVEVYDETGNVYWSTAGWISGGNTYYEAQNLQPWTTSWINNAHWTNHHRYRVISKVRDRSQNLEAVKTENTRYFIYDSTNPTSIVIEPANLAEGKNISNMQTISGTCVDKDPGLVVGCSVAFRQTDDADADLANSWWNGTKWNGESPLWMGILPENFTLLSDTTYLWKINTTTATWGNNTWYRVYSLSRDKAGNTQNNGNPDNYNRFKYVVPEPVASITFPSANNLHFKETALSSISGGSTEGTINIQLCVRRDTPGVGDPSGIHYWDAWNSTWTVTETWISTGAVQYKQVDFSAPPVWKFDVQESTWTNGAVYTFRAKAYEPVYLWGGITERTGIVYDKTNPDSTIVVPDNSVGYYKSQLATLSGGHSDTSPGLVNKVETKLKKTVGADDWYWLDVKWASGTAAPASAQWRTANSTETAQTWYYYMPATACWSSDQLYNLETKATDKAGNDQPVYAASNFTIDDSTPTSKILEPTNGQIRSSIATVSGTANDVALSQLKEVRLAIKDEGGNWWDGNTFTAALSSWCLTEIGYTATQATWTYTGVNWANAKRYTIYLKAQDKAGNYNNTYAVGTTSVTIIADIAPAGNPSSAVVNPAEGVSYSTAVIGDLNWSGTCSDPNSPNNSGIEGSVQGAVKVRLLKLTSPTTKYWDGSNFDKVWYSTYPFINGYVAYHTFHAEPSQYLVVGEVSFRSRTFTAP